MTGVSWLDWLTVVAFAALAAVSLGRLARRRAAGAGERADAAAHGVMAVGMAAMALPTGNPVPTGVWVAAFALVGAWAAGAVVRSTSTGRWRPAPSIRGPGPPPAGAAGTGFGRLPLSGAAHHVAASVLMIVLLTTAHPAHYDIRYDTQHDAHLTHHHPAHHHAGEVASAAALSPPTPLITVAGLGFLAYAAWLAAGLVRPRSRSRLGPARCDAASGVAMAAGMGLMALAMA